MKIIEKKYENIPKTNIGLETGCTSQTDSCDILNIQTFHFTSNLQSVHKLGNVQTLRRNNFIFLHKKRKVIILTLSTVQLVAEKIVI